MKRTLLKNVALRKIFPVWLAVMSTVAVYAQQTAVTGQVVDRQGLPLAGATIVDRSNPVSGVVSTSDGTFTIAVDPTTTLGVSMIGYETAEVALQGRTSVTVTLSDDIQLIDDVVVVGYGTMRRKDLTGSVASIGESVLGDKPVSVGQALQGRAPGVFVIDNGNPQENVTLKIRGLGTINDSNPLYVIDGVPSSLGLNALNPADIEAIDILKDASATAIYGSQGANGVVMVTTKKGRSGKGVLSLSVNTGLSQATNIPKFLNAAQYAALNNEIMLSAGEDTNPDWADPSSLGKGTDWIGLMFGNALRQDYNLSWSGGNDTSTYYISGGYANHQGIVNSVGFSRATFQVNSEHRVAKWLKLGENITFSTSTRKNGSYNLPELFRSLPTQPVYNEDGGFDGPDGNSLWHGTIVNQYATSELNKFTSERYDLLGSVFAEVDLFKGLKFKTLASIEAKFQYSSNFVPAYPYKPTAVPETEYERGTDRNLAYLLDNYFTYDRTFGNHTVGAMLGSSLNWGANDWFNGRREGFLNDNVHQLNNGDIIETLYGSASEWAIASFMFRVNYSYKDRYLITATVRHDGSSRFGANRRWGTFPSFSAAWRISEEEWFGDNGFVTSLKLRAGYGVTGNQKIGDYVFFAAYDLGQYSFNDNIASALTPKNLPNPDVFWEEVHQANIGIDIGMWKERLRLTFDIYNKDTRGMLVRMAVPASSGYSTSTEDRPFINAGKMNNRGIEVGISADLFRGDRFSWTSDLNFTLNRNKIVRLNDNERIFSFGIGNDNVLIQAEGHPFNSFYGRVTAGLFQTPDQVEAWSVQNGFTAPGDIRFLDLNNDGVIDEEDRTYIGNPNPPLTFAWNNTFRYRAFDLGIFLQGIYGNDVFNGNRINTEAMSGAINQYATVLGRWTGEGTSNIMPRAVQGDPNGNTRSSTRFVEDGSYLRLKNLTFGYTLPERFAQRAHIKQLRVYISCQNLLTLTNYSGFDPEVGLNGVDNGNYPVTRTFSIGLDFKL